MLAALSIDLDGLEHYHRIHGLRERSVGPDPVYGQAAQRFGELCARLGVRGTVFCVGRSLEDERARASIRQLAQAGHEIANHSHWHDYALSRRSRPVITADVRAGAEAVVRVAGRRPVGFRAPGYTLTARLVSVLSSEGYRYDSSAFPALPYYLGKAAVLGALAVMGRPSAAVLDRPRVLLAPRRPYHPRDGEPYRRGSVPLLELPITTGLAGFPLIGTFIGTLPPWAVRTLAFGARRLPLLNLELHGLDFLDASDASPALAAHQRDLRVPAARKVQRLEAFIRSRSDRTWMTLEDAAQRLAPW